MVYQVLARKYRPSSFSELVGQDVLVQTLTNAINLNRLHHAYLLTGIRGIGKTTTARIIAKNFNCEKGVTSEPCGVCFHCKSIANGSHPDILEFDAASNTGIDDIKELIEGINYTPVAARKKVYIIDEVHMLSIKAFNAILKTLEEPPENVIFIFATTEVQKLPITILSRCQRFYLRALEQEELARHISYISKQEGFKIEEDAALLIAQKADGSVRDAISLLDQVIISNISSKDITKEGVSRGLNLSNRADIVKLLDLLLVGKVNESLEKYQFIINSGVTDVNLIADLMDLVNILLKIKLEYQKDKLSFSADEYATLINISKLVSVSFLIRFWQILIKINEELLLSGLNRIKMEIGIVKLAYCSNLPTTSELVEMLTNNDLKRVLSEFGAENVRILE